MLLCHDAARRARNILYHCLAAVITCLLMPSPVLAVTANPAAFVDFQPDGTSIKMHVRGDEHFNWAEDLRGYTILQHQGWYEYARLNPQGKLVPSGLRVGTSDPAASGLKKGLRPSAAERAKGAKVVASSSSSSAQSVAPMGDIRNLVVLIRFANHLDRNLPSVGELDVLFNAPGGDPVLAPTGSVRDVFLVNSYGVMSLESEVQPWVTVTGTEQYYANGNSGDSTLWQALREALNAIDALIDFRDFDSNGDGRIDSIAFLHSGFGAEWGGSDEDGTGYTNRIWSHRWAIQNPPWVSEEGVEVFDYHISPALWGISGGRIGRIGVIAHETGHFFGLPDLYDTDGGGAGIGSYGLMANSWDFSGSQLCPPHLSPWSKMQLGWISPVDITGPGEFSLGQSESNNEYFRINSGYSSNEYLLIENRQNAGFDCSMPQGGLAIWHIDDEAGFNTEGYPGGRWPSDGKHYRVALAQADGNFNLEKGHNRGDAGDVHHGGGVNGMAPGPDLHPNTDGYQNGRIVVTGHTISDISASGPTMTFCLNGCGGGGDPGGFNAPDNLAANVTTSGRKKSQVKNVTLSWSDNSNGADNEDQFVIERCQESGKGKNKTCVFSARATVGQDVTSFSEATDSETYKYRVKARRGASDDTPYSNEVKI